MVENKNYNRKKYVFVPKKPSARRQTSLKLRVVGGMVRLFYNSHIIFAHLTRDVKYVYTRKREEFENSYGHGRRERSNFQVSPYYFSDIGTVGKEEGFVLLRELINQSKDSYFLWCTTFLLVLY